MNVLSKFFGKKSVATPLEEFIGTITLEQSRATYHSVKNESLRLPAALSTWALYLVQRFSIGLREMLAKLDKQSYPTNDSFPYDAVAFEAAAYCHYWLMRDMLNADDDDDEPSDDTYFECLKDSANITSSLLAGKVSFDLPNDLLMKRSIAYSFEEKCKSVRPEEKFAQFLISSVQSRSPLVKTPVGIESRLSFQLVVASYIPIFESTYLAEFKKSARGMFLADQEGAL